MAPTIELIESITLSSSAANVTFSNIPQGYDDLLLVCSARSTRGPSNLEDGLGVRLNSITTGYTYRLLSSVNTTVSSQNTPFEQPWTGRIPANGATANTFSNTEVYIPNYAGSTAKSYSATSVSEHNGNDGYITVNAINNTTTAAINQLFISALNGNLVSNSTFELYGIKDADDGAEGYFGPAAQGGDEVYTTGDGYKVHVFKTSGTLTVTNPGEVEYLVVAGGGGGGGRGGGGGGAGGYLTSTRSINSGFYPVVIGAGGVGSTDSSTSAASSNNTPGNDSFVGSLLVGIGGGRGGGNFNPTPSPGGSGGGGASDIAGGAAINGQGNSGGTGSTSHPAYGGGGGGGAGATGSNGSSSIGGNGGNGLASSITGSSIVRAGGGGGGAWDGSNAGSGGTGGGGAGVNRTTAAANSGTVNTGGGGGGASGYTTGVGPGGSGGSGIVIIRYKI